MARQLRTLRPRPSLHAQHAGANPAEHVVDLLVAVRLVVVIVAVIVWLVGVLRRQLQRRRCRFELVRGRASVNVSWTAATGCSTILWTRSG
jgi:hypothetical protein